MKSSLASVLLISCLTINATSAFALDVNKILGQKTTKLSPNGKSEVCAIANKMNPSFYDASDLDDEAKLCDMDFYTDYALCPKQISTNPGVGIAALLNGKTREETMAVCRSNCEAVSVKAKFKNSITCSYAPSILAYYHFSRILKAGRVPVAVLRTMDREEHLKIAQVGYDNAKATAITKTTWKQFLAAHNALTSTKLFDDSKQFVYGALSVNPKHEEKYSELSASPYEVRYEKAFVKPQFVRLTNPASVQQIAGTTDVKVLAQLIVQMKDMTDMILLDTLFSQDDRIGNLHYKAALYSVQTDPATGKSEFKSDKATSTYNFSLGKWNVSAEDAPKIKAGQFLVREMMMKDNDCGVDVTQRSNMMRKMSAIEGLKHISPRTYKKFMKFYKVAKTPETLDWMKNELQFTAADIGSLTAPAYKTYISNLEKAYSVLYNNCKNGSLKLDLDVNSILPGNPLEAVSCDQ